VPAPAAPAAPAAHARTDGICAGAATLLGGLKRPMRIDVYVTRGLPALDRFVAHLEAVLAEYKDAARGNLEIAFLDGSDPAVKTKAEAAGLREQALGYAEAEGEEAQLKTGFLGLTVAYGSANGVIKLFSPENPEGLEFWIVEKMREVRDKGDGVSHPIGVLVGHGEPRFDDKSLISGAGSSGQVSMQTILTQNFPEYRLVDVDTRAGVQPIDPSLEGLFVLQPARDLSEPELRRIDDFVLAGKSVAFVASAVNVRAGDAKLHATIDRHRLDTLLAGYGFDLHADAVLDFGRSSGFTVATQTGIARLAFPWIPRFDEEATLAPDARPLDTTHPILFRLPSVTFPFASSLSLDRTRQPDATFRVLARTSAQATLDSARDQEFAPTKAWAPRGGSREIAIAAVARGTMKSAFGSAKGRRPSRMLVLASASAFANPFVVAGRGGQDAILESLGMAYAQEALTNTILALKNTIDWMVGEDDLSDCTRALAPRSKPARR
jgi:hypothetical protein